MTTPIPSEELEISPDASSGPLNSTRLVEAGSDLHLLMHSIRMLGSAYDPANIGRTVLHMARHSDPSLPELCTSLFGDVAAGSSKLADAARSIEILARAEASRLGYVGDADQIVETARSKHTSEPQTIAIGDIALFPKKSTVQYHLMKMRRTNPRATSEDVLAEYRSQNYPAEKIERILGGHDAHCRSMNVLRGAIPDQQVFDMDHLSDDEIRKIVRASKLIVVASGDNHAQRVSHYVDDQLVVFINSDPRPDGSRAAHAHFIADDFAALADRLRRGNYLIEDWTRIELEINGRLVPLALSEISMAEKEHDQFSRLSLKHRGREHLWQGSGGVVSTGYGSCDNSWFQSATRFQAPLGNLIPRTSPQLLLAPREINGEVKPNDLVLGTLEPGETLEVTSMLRHDGIISIDATHHEPFPLGSVAKIRISDRPLRVISDQV